jgi:hypothetical protein
VSLVDNGTGTEVTALPYPNKLARAVAIGDDDQTVLVVIDDAVKHSRGQRAPTPARRGHADRHGRQRCVRCNRVHQEDRDRARFEIRVALVDAGANGMLISFSIPGLAQVDAVPLAGRTGQAVVFDLAGTKVYVRSGGPTSTLTPTPSKDSTSMPPATSDIRRACA